MFLWNRPIYLFEADEGGGGIATDPGDVITPAQPTPATTPPQDDWQKRHAGLQKHAQGLQTRLTKAQAEYQAALEQYEGQITTLTTDFNTVKGEKESLASEKTRLQQETLSLKKQLDVVNKILGDPELAVLLPLQAKGLLAVGNLEGEELVTYLKDYATTLAGIRTDAVKQTLSGTMPSSASGAQSTAGLTEDQLWDMLMHMPLEDPRYPALKKQFDEMGNK